MRSTTRFAHMMRACILAVALLALPQLASAQLPLETRQLKLQATSGGNTVTLDAPTVSTSYTLTYPAALGGGAGSFMFLKPVTGGSPIPGQMAWTNAPAVGETTLYWDGNDIKWVNPNASTNPNWSLTGNNLTGNGKLGSITAYGVNIVTTDLTRIAIAATGEITISNQTTFNTGGDPDLVVTESSITRVGAIAINPGSGNDITTNGGITSAENVTITTGGLTLSGEANPISVRGSDGTDGFALVSKGTGNSPEWQSINNAVGIRESGKQEFTSTGSITVTGVPNLAANDAIIVTVEGSGSVVVAQVTARTAAAAGPPATDGSFTVTLSAVTSGFLNYMVIKNQ